MIVYRSSTKTELAFQNFLRFQSLCSSSPQGLKGGDSSWCKDEALQPVEVRLPNCGHSDKSCLFDISVGGTPSGQHKAKLHHLSQVNLFSLLCLPSLGKPVSLLISTKWGLRAALQLSSRPNGPVHLSAPAGGFNSHQVIWQCPLTLLTLLKVIHEITM